MAMHSARGRALAAILALGLGLAIPVQGAGSTGMSETAAQAWEWTFRVTADPAPVRAAPDLAAPQIETLAKGAQVRSFAAAGAWIRVIITRRDGSVVIGYASVNDVELVDTVMNESAIYWTSLEDGYRGARLAVRFSAGLGTSGGGDVVRGSKDLLWVIAAQLEKLGYRPVRQERPPFPPRTSYNGEILYRMTPRFEAGLGASKESAHSASEFNATQHSRAMVEPGIDALTAFATVAYLLPINRSASLRLSGGPLLTRVRYSIRGTYPTSEARINVDQTAAAWGLGARLGAALEINLGARKALFFEVSGRDGVVRGFRGTEDSLLMVGHWMEDIRHIDGPLCAVGRTGLTRLMILSAPSQAPGPFRDAYYSMAGIDIRAGFRIRI